MKKILGVSLLSTMLIFGQPFIALADTTGSRTINFEDIESIIAEKNIDIQINQNERLKSIVSHADLKRTIKDLEDDLEDINDQRELSGNNIALSAEKRALLDALKLAERGLVDQPTLVVITDLKSSMSDDSQTRYAESDFIKYNQANLDISDISMNIDNIQDKLATMQLQESLGLIARNDMNALRTSLVAMQTKLESTKLQQDSYVRELKDLLNEQENTLVIGSIPSLETDFTIEDEDSDLEKALQNSYKIKIQEQQIVMLQSALERAKKDHGMSSKEYKEANYELTNANLKLTQLKDTLKSDYYTMIDDIAKMKSDLRLAEQSLEDKKVALSEAQVRLSLGMITQLEMDSATMDYQVQENALKTKHITLFNAKCGYDWFLKGMPRS